MPSYWYFLKHQIKALCFIGSMGIVLPLAVGCGQSTSIKLTEKITVSMVGVFESPQDADGNAEPRSMEFTLQGLALNGAEGNVDLLAEGAEPIAYRIVNRSQIIAEADVADYVGQSYNGITVTFASEAVAKGKIEDELVVVLVNPVLQYEDAVSIDKAKSFRLNINVQWKNIITRDEDADPASETVSPPAFSLEIKYD